MALTGLLETGFNQGLYSLAYDLSTNTLYGNTSRRFHTIDPATGAATLVGGLDLLDSTATGTTFIGQHGANTSLPGLAFLGSTAPVPELSTWTMMIAGFGFAGIALRRTNRSKTPKTAAA